MHCIYVFSLDFYYLSAIVLIVLCENPRNLFSAV